MWKLTVLLGLISLPTFASAHDLWLEPSAAALVLRYGHRAGALLDLDAAKVKTVRCRPAVGGAVSDLRAAAAVSAKEIRVSGACVVASAFLDNGTWSLTPDGEKNLPRSQVPDAVKAWESRQFAKWVDSRSSWASEPVGDAFEIVPVTDLSKVRSGDKATFRVLLDGAPVNGAIVAIDHKALGETDSAGEVRVRIRAADVESISATFKRPLTSPDADSQVWECSLSFEVAK